MLQITVTHGDEQTQTQAAGLLQAGELSTGLIIVS